MVFCYFSKRMVFGKGLIHSVLGLLMSSKELFLLLFIIPTIAIWIHIDLTAINLIYFIATELILAHVIYGGYVILKGQEKVNLLAYSLAFVVWLCLLLLFGKWADTITEWFISLIVIFLVALIFHFYSRTITRKKYVQELCNYKIYIEISGIILAWLGIVLTKLFQHDMTLGISNIILILIINYIIFFRRKAYDKLVPQLKKSRYLILKNSKFSLLNK